MKPILIIDADQNYGRLLTQNLRREGYAVMQAGNLDEAKRLLEDSGPFVIASALLLPDGSGFEVLDYVHEKASNIPVVVFSNYGQDIVGESILQCGATRYFCRSEIDRLQETIMDFANQALSVSERPFLHRLLYVCADPVKAGILRAALRQRQFYTMLTSDLREAQAKLIAGPGVELILCDTMLPQGSALKFLEVLKKGEFFRTLCQNIPPCVMIRPQDDPIPEGEYLQEGAYDCIPGPLYFPTLLTALEDYFELPQND